MNNTNPQSARRLRVAIIFGGQSAEHEISILSARNVLAALDRTRFEPLLIGIDKNGQWLLQDEQRLLASARDPRQVSVQAGPPAPLSATSTGAAPRSAAIDVVFPVLHGTLGEDGAMQGLLEMAGLPYVGAGILGSAIGMDKDVMKRLLRDGGVPVTPFVTVRRDEYERDHARIEREIAALGFPLFIKPANAGSSVGVSKVKTSSNIGAAVRFAFEFDRKILAEAGIVGREVEIGVLGGNPPTASTVAGEIVVEHADGFYSYDAKYVDPNGARLSLPAILTDEQLAQGRSLALRAFEILECDGMARADFFLRADGQWLLNEINTIPGFTAISMYPKLWELSGVAPMALVSRLIDLALERARQRAALRHSHDLPA